MSETFKVLFVPGMSVVALDDDKLKYSHKVARENGVVVKKIWRGFGPVFHSVASVLTDGGHIQKTNDSLRTILETLLTRLTGASHASRIDTRETVKSRQRS